MSVEIGARIAQFRIQRGLTQATLATHMDLAPDQLCKIEKGRRRPEITELAAASEVLGVSLRELIGVADEGKLALAARVGEGATLDILRPMRVRARQLIEVDHVLTEMVGLRTPEPTASATAARARGAQLARLPARGRTAHESIGEEFADYVRELLQIGTEPITDLPNLIEARFGVDVALFPFPDGQDGHKPDGLCVHTRDTRVIIANSLFTPGHVRFTLAHELAHHLFGDPREVITESPDYIRDSSPIEQRANAFAGAFLMPRAGVIAECNRLENANQVSPAVLRHLVIYFDASLAAMIYRLNVLKLLSFDEGQRLRRAGISRLPDALTGPVTTAIEPTAEVRPPTRLALAALDGFSERRIGLNPLATLQQRENDDDFYNEITAQLDELVDFADDEAELDWRDS